MVYETAIAGHTYLLTNGFWYKIEKKFADRILKTVKRIPKSKLQLPAILKDAAGKLETEPAYNKRAAKGNASYFALLDAKLAKCATTSSGIEVCDLLSKDRHFVHIKHRKGGSSSLSHLFAQGRMSAEALLADEGFRKSASTHLKKKGNTWARLIPVKRPDPGKFSVVFTILGAKKVSPGVDLPFFSQLNLSRTYESLIAMGYKVEICGVEP